MLPSLHSESALALLAVALGLGAVVAVILAGLRRHRAESSPCGTPTRAIAVIVLGDFGRSPRMQHHALSLAQHGRSVHVVAHSGTAAHPRVSAHPHITVHTLEPFVPPAWLPGLAALPFKAVAQAAALAHVLAVRLPTVGAMLVQNPPAIPTLAVAHVACRLRGARLIIDWHNYAYTILAIALSSRGGRSRARTAACAAVVRVAEIHERLWARLADSHLCVSEAMALDLRTSWRVHATVLYDRPAAVFAPLSAGAQHALLARLHAGVREAVFPALPPALAAAEVAASAAEPAARLTLRTRQPMARGAGANRPASLRPDRPAIVVSSTSWTADEDFGLLLRALVELDARLEADRARGAEACRVVTLITGRGPLREHYEAQLRTLALRSTHVATLWLAAEDYPQLLACADVGVCLHASSSGVDLPMKIVDLFGAGVPVCALKYGCIGELVHEGETGLLFSTATELASQLHGLLARYPHETRRLDALREGVGAWRGRTWDQNWGEIAAPMLCCE